MSYGIAETDGDTIAAEILLLRDANDKAILIVEGPSDEKFFTPFVSDEHCEIVISYGRQHSLRGLAIVTHHGYAGILVVIDQDFDSFLHIEHNDLNVVVNRDHDIETTMLRSPAFEKVLVELGSKKKIKAIIDLGADLRQIILDPVHPLGVLRLYSLENGINLKFEELRFRFLSRKLTFELREMISEVFNHSQIHNYDIDAVVAYIEAWRQRQHEPWLMCCGHDLVCALGRALQSLIGSHSAGATHADHIESQFRLAFSADDFRATGLNADIRAWEARNAPYRCLR